MTTDTKDKKALNTEVILSNILSPRLNKYSVEHKMSTKMVKEKLAAHLGVDLRNITRWMNNNTQPSLTEAIQISKFLGLPVESIFTIHE